MDNFSFLMQVYTYDAAGNRLTMADSYGTVNYQYNNANELQGSVLVVAEGTAANIPVATQPKFSTSTPVNVFTGVTATKTNKITTTYQYDGNGNMINKTENGKQMQYEYDYENRLVKVTYPDNSYEKYIYSPVGKRLAIERYASGGLVPVDTRYFIYDALRCNNVYEFSTSTTTINRYIYINPGNELVAKISTLSANLLSLSYYHSDSLGSVSLVTNNTGSVVNTYNYDAFGNILNSTGKGDAYKFIGTIYGVEDDGMSGLYHMNNRYYDASTGRFVSRDIVRGFVNDPLSLNRYVYCKNNPVMYIDPEGLSWYGDLSVVSEYVTENVTNYINKFQRAEEIGIQVREGAFDIGLSGSWMGPQDAWRHAEWNRRMTEELGLSIAIITSYGYELKTILETFENQKPIQNILMDLHNNREGRRIAGTTATANDLLKGNQLRTINPPCGGKGGTY